MARETNANAGLLLISAEVSTSAGIDDAGGWSIVVQFCQTAVGASPFGSSFCAFSVRTGQGARLVTSSATLPRIKRFSPDRPVVPMTIRSAFSSAATDKMAETGIPSTYRSS